MLEIYACHALLIHVSYIYGVLIALVAGDKIVGEVSRLVVAEACIQALDIEFTEGEIYEINSVEVSCKGYFKDIYSGCGPSIYFMKI